MIECVETVLILTELPLNKYDDNRLSLTYLRFGNVLEVNGGSG